MAFVGLTTAETDADSPLDTTLMTKVKENFDDLDSRIAASYSASNTVPQGGLKTAVQSGSTSSSTPVSITLTGGAFCFLMGASDDKGASSTAGITQPYLKNPATGAALYEFGISGVSSGITLYWSSTYIQASPPYKLGGLKWNHFFFILREITTGSIVATSESPDPCWQNNGRLDLPKDHPDKIAAVPHPFVDYYTRAPATDGLEIVLLDMRAINLKLWRKNNEKFGKNISGDLQVFLPSKGTVRTHAQLGMAGLSAFEDDVKIITP